MSAPVARAEFLKTAERFAIAENVTIGTRWGEDALDTRQSSCLRFDTDAAAEAARQLAQLDEVRARDAVVIAGVHLDLEGSTVRVPYNGRLGLTGARDLLVVRARVDRNRGLTEIEGEVLL
ncbi:hypothetical protein [Thermaurantiacus tibetensis]|uniref:hypothetical protein n=1 Tax=Thermaurantiacus tibetensis TaxID=2759035 RepID=UPI00188EA306|nr:hypothetical protein [Thermaurantiacus tibetensis]